MRPSATAAIRRREAGILPRVLALWVLVIALACAACLYAGDFFWFEYRGGGAGEDVGQMTVFYGTVLKNGKVEVFYDQPTVQNCVHAIFPHGGDDPCWYLSRHSIILR